MIDKQEFQQAVFDIVRLVPSGRATTYGAIARAIGYPNHSRLVGKVLNGCSSSYDDIPAHRVANSQGELVARDMFGCSGEMEKLLEAEGIEIFNHRICSWRRVFWNPMMELRL